MQGKHQLGKINQFLEKTLDFNNDDYYDYCMLISLFHGLIAQWIEHPPSKRVVVGSNPTQSVPIFSICDLL